MAAPLTIGGGITIGGGVSVGPDVSAEATFTISSSDFTIYNGIGVTSNGNLGFTSSSNGPIGQHYYMIGTTVSNGFSPTKETELQTYWTDNSLTYTNSYMFNVTWSDSSTSVVCASYTPSNYIEMSPVDTSISGWDTPGQDIFVSPTTIPGTYSFPATFSVIKPLITDNHDWC